jgi:hypothetical protein
MLAFVSEPLNKFIWRERHSEKMRSICEHGSEQLQGNRKTFDFESAKHEKIDGSHSQHLPGNSNVCSIAKIAQQ